MINAITCNLIPFRQSKCFFRTFLRDKGLHLLTCSVLHSSTRASLWSEVHVLQWLQGHTPNTWCNDWIQEEEGMSTAFISATETCPCTLTQALLNVARFSPHPQCNRQVTSSSNCAFKLGAAHCVRAINPRYIMINWRMEI